MNTSDETAPPTLHLTDVGNAGRLIKRYGHILRYCHDRRQWLAWDGKRWGVDKRRRVVNLAKATVRVFWSEVEKKTKEAEAKHQELHAVLPDDPMAKIKRHLADAMQALADAMNRWARQSESRSRIEAMVSLAEPDVPITSDELDVTPWLLNVDNGTLDLRTGKLKPHDQADYISKLCPVIYDATATSPVFVKFLDRVMAGNVELIDFLQRAVGYSLTGSTKEQCLFLFHGGGANGKSTLLNVVLKLLGDYAMSTPTDTLLVKKGDGPRNDVARLKGARLVSAVETEDGKRFAEALVKQMTGGDPVTSRFLYGEFFEYVPVFKLFLAVNYKPVIRGSDLAIWRRIHLVPFDVTIPKHEQDGDLPEKLKLELPGILRWALQGCLDWQEHGLKPPSAVQAATSAYRTEMDTFKQWLPEFCEIGDGCQVSAAILHNAYSDWCREEGLMPMSQTAFGLRLSGLGLVKYRDTKGNRAWKGIRLLALPMPPTGNIVIPGLTGPTSLTGSSNSSHVKE